MKKFFASLMLCALGLTGCTTIKVHNQANFQPQTLKKVCVIHNPLVAMKNFDQAVVNSFSKHGVQAIVYPTAKDASVCETTMNYTALRSWDLVPYMTYAELNLLKNDQPVSQAIFRLRANGGIAPSKWRSTESKINLLVDRLLKTQ